MSGESLLSFTRSTRLICEDFTTANEGYYYLRSWKIIAMSHTYTTIKRQQFWSGTCRPASWEFKSGMVINLITGTNYWSGQSRTGRTARCTFEGVLFAHTTLYSWIYLSFRCWEDFAGSQAVHTSTIWPTAFEANDRDCISPTVSRWSPHSENICCEYLLI